MATSTTLYWLRNDLRVFDNEALVFAAGSDKLLPVYVIDQRNATDSGWGFERMGAHRRRFLEESLVDVDQQLRERNSGLLITEGEPAKEIIRWLETGLFTRLVFEEEATTEEAEDEVKVLEAADRLGIEVTTFWGRTLLHPDDLPFALQDIPFVFTDFRRQVEKKWRVRSLVSTPDVLPPLPDLSAVMFPLVNLADMRDSVAASGTETTPILKGGTLAGQEHLQAYLVPGKVDRYKETRNGLLGEDYSTKFSPWLALGCVSPRMIYHEIKRFEQQYLANESTYWVIFELLWRDFFRFIAFKYESRLFQRGGLTGKAPKVSPNEVLFERWCNGNTGVPFIDAMMRELRLTGFMSNRARQNAAAFAVHYLEVDWRACAYWFEHQLVDYDPASNWGNWAYVAGVGNDPRARFFNVVRQAQQYDAQAEFIYHWVPEVGSISPQSCIEPWRIPATQLKTLQYPPCIVDLKAIIALKKED